MYFLCSPFSSERIRLYYKLFYFVKSFFEFFYFFVKIKISNSSCYFMMFLLLILSLISFILSSHKVLIYNSISCRFLSIVFLKKFKYFFVYSKPFFIISKCLFIIAHSHYKVNSFLHFFVIIFLHYLNTLFIFYRLSISFSLLSFPC